MLGFLSNNLYYKYLNDLINSVRVDEFTGGYANTPSQGWTPEVDRNSSATEGSQAQVRDCLMVSPNPTLPLFFIIIFKNMVASMSNLCLDLLKMFSPAARC